MDKEKKAAYAKAWNLAHRGQVYEYKKKWRREHRSKENEYRRIYKLKHREKYRLSANKCARRYSKTEKYKENRRKLRYTPTGYYYQLKRANKRKRIEVFVCSRAEFLLWWGKQIPVCYYCKQPVKRESKVSLTSLTIDRKNPNRGYLPSNMVFCCNRCNIAKGNWFTQKLLID